ncbi:hypothetical protein ANRL3_01481 [Anaerolineae bacterium]|nr:hypothetical protein ANRL3_01481 [Anaerolineae bacterium]
MSTKNQKSNNSVVVNPDLEAQRKYTEQMRGKGFDFSLMVADAFVRGIRDIGYKSTATALDELIDNAVQAGAANIHVAFGFEGKSTKPIRLAIIDDGHGMDADMTRMSIIWGGTHRHNDRSGFGRYGYGLPSASISQGRRFEVYSAVEGAPLIKGWLDLDEIANGHYTNSDHRIIVPEPIPGQLPDWVNAYLKANTGSKVFSHGTVVVLDKLDRLTWVTESALSANLLEHIGVVYRNFLREVNIVINGKRVEPTDPLFTTPGCRFYEIDEDRADSLEPISFEVKDQNTSKALGLVKVRYSYIPPTFARYPEDKPYPKSKGQNPRFKILKEYNQAIIVLRNGRQIDSDIKCPWTTFNNDDRYWGVEIDFPATLDEEFSITTSKQQVVLSDRMWVLLEQAGVKNVIAQLRKRYDKDTADLKARNEEAKQRASELAMVEAEKFKIKRPGGPTPAQNLRSERQFSEEVKRRAQQSGLPTEIVADELRAKIQGHPFKVEFESLPGAPFYRTEQMGGQKVLYLNRDHRFFTNLYAGPESTPYLRASMEVLLFVLGDSELDSEDDRRQFYEMERRLWSDRLSVGLNQLQQFIAPDNKQAETLGEHEV